MHFLVKVPGRELHKDSMTQRFDPFDPGEWVDNPGCEAFEIAIDMRAKSALAESAFPVLDAHLGACESCRAYAASAGQQDAALAVAATTAPAPADWQRLQDKMQAGVKRYRRVPWVLAWSGLSGLAFYSGLRFLALGEVPSMVTPLAIFAGFMAVMLSLYAWNSRRMRKLLEQRDVVATYRAELERSLRISKRTWWLGVVSVPLYAALAAMGYESAMRGDPEGRVGFVMWSVTGVMMSVSLVSQFRAARRARRELEELH